jgi:hypothetical protein
MRQLGLDRLGDPICSAGFRSGVEIGLLGLLGLLSSTDQLNVCRREYLRSEKLGSVLIPAKFRT